MLIAFAANAQVQDTFFGCKLGMNFEEALTNIRKEMKILWDISNTSQVCFISKNESGRFSFGGFVFDVGGLIFNEETLSTVGFTIILGNEQEAKTKGDKLVFALSRKYKMVEDEDGSMISADPGPTRVMVYVSENKVFLIYSLLYNDEL